MSKVLGDGEISRRNRRRPLRGFHARHSARPPRLGRCADRPRHVPEHHGLHPPALSEHARPARRLGVLDTLQVRARAAFTSHRLVALGASRSPGVHTVEGFDLGLAPRRIALDKAGVDTALAAGATGIFGTRVVDLIGPGPTTTRSAASGLTTAARSRPLGVRRATAGGRWSPASSGSRRSAPQRGELAFSYSYWSGIPLDEPVSTLRITASSDRCSTSRPSRTGSAW